MVLALAATSGFHLSGRSESLFENDDKKLVDDPLLGSGESVVDDLPLGLLAELLEFLQGPLAESIDPAHCRPVSFPPTRSRGVQCAVFIGEQRT